MPDQRRRDRTRRQAGTAQKNSRLPIRNSSATLLFRV